MPNRNHEKRAYGLRVLMSRHPEIRKLKRMHAPSVHGNKPWTSSWLLIDYFRRKGLKQSARVMEVGCGWGLTGIYCAKKYGASVTGVDIDPDVFPYTELHARINRVEMATMKGAIGGVTTQQLKGVDVLLGADICFWEKMVLPLKRLIGRAIRAGVGTVLIADPVRAPFEELADHFIQKEMGELLDWKTRRPRPIHGQILLIKEKR
ncbi:methyltransferase [Thermodesulfobacteriota bacterium]